MTVLRFFSLLHQQGPFPPSPSKASTALDICPAYIPANNIAAVDLMGSIIYSDDDVMGEIVSL